MFSRNAFQTILNNQNAFQTILNIIFGVISLGTNANRKIVLKPPCSILIKKSKICVHLKDIFNINIKISVFIHIVVLTALIF